MKRVAIFVLVMVAVMGLGLGDSSCLAKEKTEFGNDELRFGMRLWTQYSRTNKKALLVGYKLAASTVCAKKNLTFDSNLNIFCDTTNSEVNYDKCIEIMDYIYSTKEYNKTSIHNLVLFTLALVSNQITPKTFLLGLMVTDGLDRRNIESEQSKILTKYKDTVDGLLQ